MLGIGADDFRGSEDCEVGEDVFIVIMVIVIGPEDEVSFAEAVAIDLISDFPRELKKGTARCGSVLVTVRPKSEVGFAEAMAVGLISDCARELKKRTAGSDGAHIDCGMTKLSCRWVWLSRCKF